MLPFKAHVQAPNYIANSSEATQAGTVLCLALLVRARAQPWGRLCRMSRKAPGKEANPMAAHCPGSALHPSTCTNTQQSGQWAHQLWQGTPMLLLTSSSPSPVLASVRAGKGLPVASDVLAGAVAGEQCPCVLGPQYSTAAHLS